MQINPKVRVLLAVAGFVLLLIAPVSYAVIREWKARTEAKNHPTPHVADSTTKQP